MREFILSIPNTFIPLFVAIDIFIVLPIFTSMTEGMTQGHRKTIVRQSVLTALFVGLVFIAIGEAVFNILGITSNDFKVAGGLILFVFAVLDITRYDSKKLRASETTGVVPIGVPLIVGPAVLTTILVLVDHYGVMSTIASLILNLVFVWISLQGAQRIIGFLGKGGVAALSKIMALLLAAIAIMMIRLGIQNILKAP